MQNLSDDDCDENEKFELPKITKLPSFTEYQKRSQQERLPTEKV